jgi:DNA-binding transcriptional LysR family regulator
VAYEQDIPTRKATDQLLREHQVTVHYSGEFDNIETIKRAVEIGQGVAIVPLASIQYELDHGTLKAMQLAEAVLKRPLGTIHKKGRHLSPAAVKFIEILQRTDLR